MGRNLGLLLIAFGCPLFAAAMGCAPGGPEFAPVYGTVFLDGAPMKGIMVVFQPEEGNSSSSVTDNEGCYRLMYSINQEGATVGQHRVKVFTPTRDDGSQPPEKIPAKYRKGDLLIEQVRSGKNQIDLKLFSQETSR